MPHLKKASFLHIFKENNTPSITREICYHFPFYVSQNKYEQIQIKLKKLESNENFWSYSLQALPVLESSIFRVYACMKNTIKICYVHRNIFSAGGIREVHKVPRNFYYSNSLSLFYF